MRKSYALGQVTPGYGTSLVQAPARRDKSKAGLGRDKSHTETKPIGLRGIMVVVGKHSTFCLLWFSGKSPLLAAFFSFSFSPSNVNQAVTLSCFSFGDGCDATWGHGAEVVQATPTTISCSETSPQLSRTSRQASSDFVL